jgi:tetratricopeptide (TPR) repeat protein
MEEVEKGFVAYAKEVANKMAPELDWEKPDLRTLLPGTGEIAHAAWKKANPTNYYVMREEAEALVEEKKWPEAKVVLEKLVKAYPGHTGSDSSYWMLAAAHRALGETNQERQVLSALAERDDAAPDAYLRLMELASEAQDWPDLLRNAQRYLAVNPLVPLPYRYLAQASEAQSATKPAIEAYRALLHLDPTNPAEVHFRLGRQLHALGDPSAKRHVLQALEEAPRYKEAIKLLLAMSKEPPKENAPIETPPVQPGPATTLPGAAK